MLHSSAGDCSGESKVNVLPGGAAWLEGAACLGLCHSPHLLLPSCAASWPPRHIPPPGHFCWERADRGLSAKMTLFSSNLWCWVLCLSSRKVAKSHDKCPPTAAVFRSVPKFFGTSTVEVLVIGALHPLCC